MNTLDEKKTCIGVIGIGYVGLPLALAFGKKYNTVAYDNNTERITDLKNGIDKNEEFSKKQIQESSAITFTSDESQLSQCNFFIIAVPTPVNESSIPDFTPVESATAFAAKHISAGDYIVFESTVYPGATEEICVPILEEISGLAYNKDFFVGYSPERVSPADKSDIEEIVKITSGSTPEAASAIDAIYASIITAGTHKAPSLKVAEAAKVIENSQRDINIAFMNEISQTLHVLGIDTMDVLAAMRTKWNALPFIPGLVGGHCIGVDPYYLIHKAYAHGQDMNILRSARVTNDGVPRYIVEQAIQQAIQRKLDLRKGKVLLLGVAFKENCPDMRNSRSIDIGDIFESYGLDVDYHDPVVDAKDFRHVTGKQLTADLAENTYDILVLSVVHDEYKNMTSEDFKNSLKEGGIFCDIKSLFASDESDFRL